MLKKNWKILDAMKAMRPKCTGSEDGKHTMVEYASSGTKECVDCPYKEDIYRKVKL